MAKAKSFSFQLPFDFHVPLIFVDVETTGTGKDDRVIEIAIIQINPDLTVRQFHTLVQPNQYIPDYIRQLTGITHELLLDAPEFSDIATEILSFFKTPFILIGHQIRFDVSMILAEFQRLKMQIKVEQTLCTLRLSRRLIPGVKSYRLESLANYLGINNSRFHRAIDDTLVTVKLFEVLLRHGEQSKLIDTFDELMSIQFQPIKTIVGKKKQITFLKQFVLDAPETSGVYRFISARGEILYVGKAKNIKKRIGNYFQSLNQKPKKLIRLVSQAKRIEWTETHSELNAWLLESATLKQIQPKYNSADLFPSFYSFIELTDHPFPVLKRVVQTSSPQAIYYGPFLSRQFADFFISLIEQLTHLRLCDDVTFSRKQVCMLFSIGKCAGACVEGEARKNYPKVIELIQSYFSGERSGLRQLLLNLMTDYSEKEQFELASSTKKRLLEFDKVVVSRSLAFGNLNFSNFLAVERIENNHVIHFIRFGKLFDSLNISDVLLEKKLKTFYDLVWSDKSFPTYSIHDVDELRIISNWMVGHQSKLRFLNIHQYGNFSHLMDDLKSL